MIIHDKITSSNVFACINGCTYMTEGTGTVAKIPLLTVAPKLMMTTTTTPCSRVLFEKLVVAQLAKKFPAFYGTRRFITVFTAIRHWILSRAGRIQSTPYSFDQF